jgi:long-chain acyl-CoA synthetase
MQHFSTLPHLVQYTVNTFSNSNAFNFPKGEGWESMSTEVFAESIRRLALGLKSLGLEKGDAVGMVASSSAHWLIVDLAVTTAGGVSVPLFSYISEKNFLYEVEDCNMKFLFVLDPSQWSSTSKHHKLFNNVIVKDVENDRDGENVLDFEHVMKLGDEVSKKSPSFYAELRDQVNENDLATIIYTTGRAGVPKGVELTHKNLICQVQSASQRFILNPAEDRVLSMLPLAHIFERMLVYYYLAAGVSIYFVDDLKNLMPLIQRARPTLGAMVPLIVEKIYSRVIMRIQRLNPLYRKIGMWLIEFAKEPPCGLMSNWIHKILDRLIYSEVRKVMGGNYRAIIVGGAALNKELCQFFLNAGIPLYQGYGLTEASPVLATNFESHNKPGTVGPVYPTVELKIAENNEIWARGPNIMKGYHGEIKGAEVMVDDEGWLHTGDMGFLDEHGFLTITGRLKEIMKTSGGKMVSPLPIETALTECPLVDNAMVVADDQKFVSALLFPNFEELALLKEMHNQGQVSHEDFLSGNIVEKELAGLLKKVNQTLNAWEQVKVYRFVSIPLTVEGGELTPTMQVNRELVYEKYKDLIRSMYLGKKGEKS